MKKKNKVFRPTAFALPYLILTLIFVIAPLVLVLVYAFKGSDGSYTFDNFVTVFTTKEYLISLLKTIGIASLTTLLCLLISYPIAYILATSPFNKMAILALLFVVPMWMNFVLRVVALQSVLSGWFGMQEGFWTAIIGLVYDFLPYMLLPIYTVLVNMDKSYVEASRDLGANGGVTFLKVTLPLSLPGVISGISMVFMPIFSAYAVTGMLGDANTGVLGGTIDALFKTSGTWGIGSAMSFVLLIIVFATMLITNLLSSRMQKAPKKSNGGAQ